jgi:hypothetical protein
MTISVNSLIGKNLRIYLSHISQEQWTQISAHNHSHVHTQTGYLGLGSVYVWFGLGLLPSTSAVAENFPFCSAKVNFEIFVQAVHMLWTYKSATEGWSLLFPSSDLVHST